MPPQNFKLKSLEIIAQENRQLELARANFWHLIEWSYSARNFKKLGLKNTNLWGESILLAYKLKNINQLVFMKGINKYKYLYSLCSFLSWIIWLFSNSRVLGSNLSRLV